jgi:transposase
MREDIMTYSIDFRRKVLQIRKAKGLSIIKTSELFKISPTSIVKWNKTIMPKAGRNKPATKIDMEALAKDVKENPDSYHYERAARLEVGTRTVGDALKRLQVTYKKNVESSEGERRRACYLSKED